MKNSRARNGSTPRRRSEPASRPELQRRVAPLPIGQKKLAAAEVLRRQFGIPIGVGVGVLEKPEALRELRKSPECITLLKEFGDERALDLGRCHAVLRLGKVVVPSTRDQNLYGMATLRFLVFPSPEEKAQRGKDLQILDRPGPYEANEQYKWGSFGEIEVGVVNWGNTRVALLTGGQARTVFWRLNNNLKRTRYKQWYDQGLSVLQQTLQKIGITHFVIPSNEVVNETLQASWDHQMSTSVLDRFYDGYASRHGYSSQQLTLTQPHNQKKNHWKILGEIVFPI